MEIKHIIFDLGGVILNIDFHLTTQLFNQMGARQFETIYSFSKQKILFDQFETGQISAAEFRRIIKIEYKLAITDEAFDAAWNAMLLDLPKERLDLIKMIHNNGVNTFLLSNTNEIHLLGFYQKHGKNAFEGCFNKEYYSHLVGKRKPEPEVFLTIIDENQLNPEHTLFLDDSIQHIESAKKIGLKAELITANNPLIDVITRLSISKK